MERPPAILLIETNPCEIILFRLAIREANSVIVIETVGTLPSAFCIPRRSLGCDSSPVIDMIVVAGDAPTMRCRDFIANFNSDPSSREIGVTVFSASDDPVERDYYLEEMGIVAYWRKPYDWRGFQRVGREMDVCLYSRAFTEGRAPPRGAPLTV